MTNCKDQFQKVTSPGGGGRRRGSGTAADAAAAEPRPSKRALRAAERRQAIVDAALVEFSAKGFAAARLEDIAARAGVGKGTIYLYFKDKEELFQELIRTSIVPIVGRSAPPPSPEMSARMMFERFIEMFISEVYQTRRADIIRLIIAEGARFPGARRVLLPRGGQPRHRRHADADPVRHLARRDRQPGDHQASAARGRAGAGRGDLARAVRQARAARRRGRCSTCMST